MKSEEAKVKKQKMRLEDYLNDGNELAKNKEYDLAIEKYKEAISIYPNYSQARFNLAIVYKKNGQYKEAVDKFNEFISLDPFNQMAGKAKGIIKELKELMKKTPVKEVDTDSDE